MPCNVVSIFGRGPGGSIDRARTAADDAGTAAAPTAALTVGQTLKNRPNQALDGIVQGRSE